MRIAFFDCEDAEKWRGHQEGVCRLLQATSFTSFKCFKGELPPLEGLSGSFDGVLISGSHYSVYDERPWIRDLEGWLRQAVAQHPQVRILGMCFGCQILAKALGGRVGKNPDGRFVLGVETIQLKPLLQQCSAFMQAAQDVAVGPRAGADGSTICPSSVRLIESHGDCVLALPLEAILLAESRTAAVEMWTMPGGNLLAVQGHAELTAADTLEKIHGAITAAGRLSKEEAEEAERSLQQDEDDAQLVTCLYRRFMEIGLPEVAATAGTRAHGSSVRAAGAAASAREVRPASEGAQLSASSSKAGTEAAASPSAACAASSSTASAAAHLLEQLQLAVGAELDKPVSEQQLLCSCNETAAGQVQQLAGMAAEVRGRLELLSGQQHHQGHPSGPLLTGLEAQVHALESVVERLAGQVVQLDMATRRLLAHS